MFRPIVGHFVAMPFLLGFVPWMTQAAFDTRFWGLAFICLFWIIGPIARGRTKFLEQTKFSTGSFIRLLLLLGLACIVGHVVGAFVFTPHPVY